jgi:transcriptional regulator with XRE-family HTH domain
MLSVATRNRTDAPRPRPELMRFAAWLRSEMARRKLGNNALAQRLDVSTSAVSQYRRALRFPRADAQRRLAAFFKVDPAEIEALLPTETERFEPVSGGFSPGIIDTLADQVAERTAGAVIKSLSPLFHHLAPDHYTEDEWLTLVRLVVVEVEGVAVEADENGTGGGQPARGERYVLWEARVSGACMAPTIPDGSRVLLERRTATPGETVAVSVDGVVMVKRLAVHKGERVLVTADGKIVHPGGDSRVMGVVCYIPAPRGPTEVR